MPPIAVRLPDDLDALVRSRAESEGLTTSELLRSIVSQWAYGAAPSVGEGYLAARQVAIQAAHVALSHAFAEEMPQTYEEALTLLQEGLAFKAKARRKRS
jgi:hypothetical protein